jgi:hypothetical protein
MTTNQTWIRLAGISGIIGGLILFAGDMLFYYDSVSTNLKLNMGNASESRIMLSGISALLATWFYLPGLQQVYYAFKPASKITRNIVTVSFAAILVSYGIIHSAYIAIASTAQLAVQYQIDIETATALASYINNTLRLFIYPVFALLSFVFISQVWKRNTLYPRWIIIFFPLIPFLFRDLINSALTGKIQIIIMGGFLNLLLVMFFTASTVALWRKRSEQEQIQSDSTQ